MIIYEVNSLVHVSVERKFLEWLRDHVKAIVALDGVIDAHVSLIKLDERMDEVPESTGFSTAYRFESKEALDNYLEKHAAAMRQDGIDRFGDHMTVYRRVLGGSLFEVHHE